MRRRRAREVGVPSTDKFEALRVQRVGEVLEGAHRGRRDEVAGRVAVDFDDAVVEVNIREAKGSEARGGERVCCLEEAVG